MSAINSNLAAGTDPDSLRPSLQRSRMYAINTVPAPNPTCMSAPESARCRSLRAGIAEPTIPDSGTLDVDNAFKPWPMEIHRVPDDDFVSTKKAQGPLSWDGTYAEFLGVPISWPEKYDRFLQAHPP
jgi:hypothetical protein